MTETSEILVWIYIGLIVADLCMMVYSSIRKRGHFPAYMVTMIYLLIGLSSSYRAYIGVGNFVKP